MERMTELIQKLNILQSAKLGGIYSKVLREWKAITEKPLTIIF